MGALLLRLLVEVGLSTRRRRKRKRKRRFVLWDAMCFCDLLVFFQEESDDDMGFGLFD